MTFIEILNNEEHRATVETIEDILSSLDSYPNGEPTLEEMRDRLIAQLEADTGFRYAL